MKKTVTNDIYMLLMRAAMGEKLEEDERALLKEFLDTTKK